MDNHTLNGTDGIRVMNSFTDYGTYTTILLLCFVFIIAPNGAILYSILRFSVLYTPKNIFVFSLAFADFIQGINMIPISLSLNGVLNPSDYFACSYLLTSLIWLELASYLTIFAITLCMFVAVRWPYAYAAYFKIKVANSLVTVIWITATVLQVIIMFSSPAFRLRWNHTLENDRICTIRNILDPKMYALVIGFPFILVPFVLVVSIYIYIFIVIRKESRQQPVNYTCAPDYYKTAMYFGILAMICLICYLPLNVLCITELWSKEMWSENYLKYARWFSLPRIIKIVLNPYCIIFKNSQLRKTIKYQLGCISTNVIKQRLRDMDLVNPNSVAPDRSHNMTAQIDGNADVENELRVFTVVPGSRIH